MKKKLFRAGILYSMVVNSLAFSNSLYYLCLFVDRVKIYHFKIGRRDATIVQRNIVHNRK